MTAGATPNAGQSLLKANNGSGLLPNLGLPNGITLTPQLSKDASPPAPAPAAATINSLSSKGELPELPNEPEEVVVSLFSGFTDVNVCFISISGLNFHGGIIQYLVERGMRIWPLVKDL